MVVVERALRLKLKPMMVPAHKTPRDMALQFAPGVFVLYNISTNSSPFRLDICREWLNEMDDVFRVVIVAGSDPVSFFLDHLRHPFNIALYFKGQYDGEAGKRRV